MFAADPRQSNTHSGSSGTATCDWDEATQDGSLLLLGIGVKGGTGQTLATPTDWTRIGSVINNGTDVALALYYIEGAAPRSGTESMSIGTSNLYVATLLERPGAKLSASLNTNASSTGNSGSPDSGSITPGVVNCLLVALLADYASSNVDYDQQNSPTNDFTIREGAANSGATFTTIDVALLDLLYPDTASISASTSISDTHKWGGIIAAFEPVATGFPLIQTSEGASAKDSVSAEWLEPTTDGNNLFAHLELAGGSDRTVTTPTGWTAIGEVDDGTAVKYATFLIEGAAPREGVETVDYDAFAEARLVLAEFSSVEEAFN